MYDLHQKAASTMLDFLAHQGIFDRICLSFTLAMTGAESSLVGPHEKSKPAQASRCKHLATHGLAYDLDLALLDAN